MTVQEFIEKYSSNDTQELNIIDYIPFLNKVEICSAIIDDTCYEDGELHMNSPARNVMYRMMLVNVYTDIDVDFGNYAEEYDLLRVNFGDKEPALGWILSVLNEDDVREFDEIMQMMLADLYFNEKENR